MQRLFSVRHFCSVALAASMLSLAAPADADAYQATISWLPVASSTAETAGYNVYVRQGSDYQGVAPMDAGLPVADSGGALQFQVAGIPMGPTSWFMVRSYSAGGIEGPRSNELSIDYASAASVVDSDGDGLVDAEEDINLNGSVDAGETDSGLADTDGDGLTDYEEINVTVTNPLLADTDGDGDLDGAEVSAGTDPNDASSNSTNSGSVCGNGIIEAGEECDDGAANSDADPEACQLDCTLHPACGDANGDGILTATDSFKILRAAVELTQCPLSRCDTDGDGVLSPSDGLRAVRAAVGQDVALECGLLVTLALDDSVFIGKTQAIVDYRDTGSTFVGEAEEVECESLLPSSVRVTFFNDTLAGRLELTVIADDDIAGGLDVARCRFYARLQAPPEEAFVVEVTEYPAFSTSGSVPNMRLYY